MATARRPFWLLSTPQAAARIPSQVASQATSLKEQCPEIPSENYLLEPMPRGTASVVGLAALALQKRDPQAVMAILAADHLITNVAYFHRLLKDAYDLAQDDYLVTLGIRPTYPATGYGYIQRGSQIACQTCLSYEVKRFKEKPDEETARSFLAMGDHDWNSGMFIWKVDRIQQEITQLMPELAENLAGISQAWQTPLQNDTLIKIWPTIKPQTVDYGIMEKANRVAVIPAVDLGWNDVGSWESLFEVYNGNQEGNIVMGTEYIGINTTNSLVISDSTDRLVVTIGVKDLIVVDTQDAILVCSRGEAQRVREVVGQLKKSEERKQYL
jgi:mannose-1-phosphate guanylyltransferase